MQTGSVLNKFDQKGRRWWWWWWWWW